MDETLRQLLHTLSLFLQRRASIGALRRAFRAVQAVYPTVFE